MFAGLLYIIYLINYFAVVVSTGVTTVVVSTGATSGATTAVVSATGSVLSLELLQATITLLIANNANTFFISFCFLILKLRRKGMSY